MSSITLTLSFNLSAIPVIYQSSFHELVSKLTTEYQMLTAPVPSAPAAESLPQPSEFKPVDGDESVPVAATKKERKNSWASLTEEQRKERLAKLAAGREAKKARKMSEDSLTVAEPVAQTETITDKYSEMKGQQLRDELADREGIAPTPKDAKPKGLRAHTPKFPHAEDIRKELRRRDAAVPEAAVDVAEADAASETSSKKARKNVWDTYTPEQKAERIAKMQAAREAKKAKASAAAAAAAEAAEGSA
jgi:hypothetical protein